MNIKTIIILEINQLKIIVLIEILTVNNFQLKMSIKRLLLIMIKIKVNYLLKI